MKNKLLAAILLLFMMTAMLAGCGKDNTDENAEDAESTEIAATDEIVEPEVHVEIKGKFLVLDANGGMMTFGTEATYEADIYMYFLQDEMSMQENMESDGNDPVVDIAKDGATFAGWTIYKGDFTEWLDEKPEEIANGSQYFSAGGYMHILLDNCEVYGESVSTGELKEILCEGKTYYAVANWE